MYASSSSAWLISCFDPYPLAKVLSEKDVMASVESCASYSSSRLMSYCDSYPVVVAFANSENGVIESVRISSYSSSRLKFYCDSYPLHLAMAFANFENYMKPKNCMPLIRVLGLGRRG